MSPVSTLPLPFSSFLWNRRTHTHITNTFRHEWNGKNERKNRQIKEYYTQPFLKQEPEQKFKPETTFEWEKGWITGGELFRQLPIEIRMYTSKMGFCSNLSQSIYIVYVQIVSTLYILLYICPILIPFPNISIEFSSKSEWNVEPNKSKNNFKIDRAKQSKAKCSQRHCYMYEKSGQINRFYGKFACTIYILSELSKI